MQSAKRSPKISHTIRLRCPLCGQAPVYKNWFRLHRSCTSCQWEFQRGDGYFLGSIYVNYLFATVLTVSLWFLLTFGFGLTGWPVLLSCAVFVFGFPLWFLRYARSIWMFIDLTLDKPDA